MTGRLRFLQKKVLIPMLLVLLVYAASILCAGKSVNTQQSNVSGLSDTSYAGSASCVSCHKSICNSFKGTAHDLTSRPASAEFVKGDLENGKNRFTYNKFMDVAVEKQGDRLYQTVYVNGEQNQREPIDIVVGSGRKGQTYLYWKDSLLFQLPVSYYSITKSWCNSPGYPPGMPRFNRLVPGRCLECHGSNASVEDKGNNVNYIERNSIVFGIDCERCHGPSAEHVAFHTAHPEEKTAKHILIEKGLSRKQNLDLCALCHSGIRQAVKPAFSFKAGDVLEDFSLPVYNADSAAMLDVHGNQYGLLTSSKCFKSSLQMTCSSCHNVHEQQVNKPAFFSERCISCHNSATHVECTVKAATNLVLSSNCIDCHMPALPSKAIFLQMGDPSKSTAAILRTHHIAIYPEISRQFIKNLKSKRRNI